MQNKAQGICLVQTGRKQSIKLLQCMSQRTVKSYVHDRLHVIRMRALGTETYLLNIILSLVLVIQLSNLRVNFIC